ncbi:hypothetical protein [Mesorhizobium sp. Z1-4]|uniref:hypothetical protein n=1 Tax=Mesorhizobium sp. Z1-4 TaxID=2448478 RepID=UPI000FD75B4D|nr:hypothetical protein [Mesorhizobium sp. Z1-4]
MAAEPAAAQTVWTAPEGQSYAMLPAPQQGTAVTGGVMLCDQQVWTLSLATEPGAEIADADGTATLIALGQRFTVQSSRGNSSIDLIVPYDALEPMKASSRLQIELGGDNEPIRFALTGSRRAITAVEQNCSARQLPTENLIELEAASVYLELGRRLRADDIRDFIISTNQLAELEVAMIEIEGNRRLFFVEICGSSWYYGVSGCNIAGFAHFSATGSNPSEIDLEGWEPVFESEGVHVYREPGQSSDGWPNLVTIPLKPGFPDKLWTWTGQRYAVEGTIQAELRTAQD